MVRLRAFERGTKPSSPITVTLVEVGGSPVPAQVHTNADGEVTIPIAGNMAGTSMWVLVPWRGQSPSPPTQVQPQVGVLHAPHHAGRRPDRRLPPPTFQNVYENVLRD